MITRICGVPGSGKTTLLAHIARKAVARPNRPIFLCGQCICDGHPVVYSNVPFPGTFKLDVEKFGSFDFGDSLLLIDEASLHFNSRDYKSFSHALQSAFRLHRHSRQSIVLASQGALDLDKTIRDLSVNLFKCSMLPLGFLRVDFIEPFFDIVNFQPVSGYDWGRWQLINPRKAWKTFDTFQPVADPLPLAPLDPWLSDPPLDCGKPRPLLNLRKTS